MKSANKLTSVKQNITGIVETAIQLIKSYSQKKKKTASQRKKSPFLANQEEISEILNNTKEDRGCGSFNINEVEDDKRQN